MFMTFACRETEMIYYGRVSKKLPSNIQQVARRKLRMINNALDLNDLRVPPGNQLEKLKGDRTGYHSIRINIQWRIVFKWSVGNAHEVEIVDYH